MDFSNFLVEDDSTVFFFFFLISNVDNALTKQG